MNARRESIILFQFWRSTRFIISEEPTLILFKEVNEDKIGDIMFYLHDDTSDMVDFNGGTLIFTLMVKISSWFLFIVNDKV